MPAWALGFDLNQWQEVGRGEKLAIYGKSPFTVARLFQQSFCFTGTVNLDRRYKDPLRTFIW